MHTLTASVRPVPEQLSELRHDYPHSIALSYGDRQMSYIELDRRADRFAGYLAQLGLKPGGAAALCMERSFDWIVAALGIMRAGAAYVPLDRAWPDARLRYAVNDSDATVLVARGATLDRLQAGVCGIDPCRDAAAIAAALEQTSRPIRAIDSESLAYVIYTSGSSGVPKGVEITHANLAHLIRWHQDAFSVTRRDRASHLAGLGFDAAVWEIWPHLCAGATVCLAADAVRLSPAAMQQWIVAERVTISFVPTVLAAPMMAMKWPSTTALRFLLTGGDTLHRAPDAGLPFKVVNNYGPTECTVVATSSALRPGAPGAPPIGCPIAGVSVYLLNEAGVPVPDGATGEIYVGGAGVARGYRNLPDATGHSFLPDPFAEAPGARMYRTGDRGARRPDGEIEFRGRLDRQIKIRGQRIELDEIGSTLTRHPDVEFSTAMVRGQHGEETQLVAYVLPRDNAQIPTPQELRQHLRRSLPECMVPAMFVRLHSLPLSPNGKLDLALLDHPHQANLLEARPAQPAVSPFAASPFDASPFEETLLALVRELLECDNVTASDNFFLAGGHSLLGMQLVLLVENAFGVDLTLQQLFESPTIERLAILIEAKLHEQRVAAIWAELLGVESVGLDDNFIDLSGQWDRIAALQQRIAAEFGRSIPIAELLLCPTVRQQAALTHGHVTNKPALPAGVLALNTDGARKSIFWLHYVNGNLASALGEDQPFIAVGLTAEDLQSLGEWPNLENIAACLVGKILATQPGGPYTIGGYCVGGILAYEIASQLRAAGKEVSLLVLLDPPSPAFFASHGSLTYYCSHPLYFLKRAARLGPQGTLAKLRERLRKLLPHSAGAGCNPSKMNVGQYAIEAAATQYRPGKYDGKALLILASDRPPHVDFLPAWQTAVPRSLHTQYVAAHHGDLTQGENVRRIANAITSHLTSPTGENPLSCRACNPASVSTGASVEVRMGIGFETGRMRSGKRPGPVCSTGREEAALRCAE